LYWGRPVLPLSPMLHPSPFCFVAFVSRSLALQAFCLSVLKCRISLLFVSCMSFVFFLCPLLAGGHTQLCARTFTRAYVRACAFFFLHGNHLLPSFFLSFLPPPSLPLFVCMLDMTPSPPHCFSSATQFPLGISVTCFAATLVSCVECLFELPCLVLLLLCFSFHSRTSTLRSILVSAHAFSHKPSCPCTALLLLAVPPIAL